jgi:hypothetical protein
MMYIPSSMNITLGIQVTLRLLMQQFERREATEGIYGAFSCYGFMWHNIHPKFHVH